MVGKAQAIGGSMQEKNGFQYTPQDEIAKVSLQKADQTGGRILVILEKHEHRRHFFDAANKLLQEAGARYTSKYAHNAIRIEDCGEVIVYTMLEINNEKHRGQSFRAIYSAVPVTEEQYECLVSRVRQ
jgi:hypothetical protein